LEQLSWPEVESAIKDGFTTAIVGAGAIEQHGPHLPLLVDAEHGKAISQLIAEKMGNALAAPTIRVGISEHHMAFSGTISVRESTFAAVCEDYVDSLARHGFTKICFVPTHGGNFGPLHKIKNQLQEVAGDRAKILLYAEIGDLLDMWRGVIEEISGLGSRVGGHADIAETSIISYLHPNWVQHGKAEVGYMPERNDDGSLNEIIKNGLKSVTANGILGDARGATAEMGERCVEVFAAAATKYFQD
jgi:creatinine amidohydrolase